MNASTYWRAQIGQATFNLVAPTIPSNLYMRLYTDSVNAAGTGTEVTTGVGYAAKILPSAPAFTKVGDVWTLTADFVFTAATGSWGTVTSMGIWDAATSGNMIFFDDLDSTVSIVSTEIFAIVGGSAFAMTVS